MRAIALAATSLALLAFGSAADAARPVAGAAPAGLHGFLLRADEPTSGAFPRTPAFAWAPVSGAKRYEFQLATSNTFRDSGPEIDIEKKHFVYDLKAGLAFRRKCWRFDYTFIRRSEEFDPPRGRSDGLHDFGSFAISRVFWRP